MELSATQDRAPEVKEVLDRVGVRGVILPLQVQAGGLQQTSLFRASLYIDLDGDKKGVHMSRLTESLYEAARTGYGSLAEFALNALRALEKKHKFKRGFVSVKGQVLLKRHTPTTNRESLEPYGISCEVMLEGGAALISIGAEVVGSTLCPHSLENTGGMAHSQRAKVFLKVTGQGALPGFEELVDIAEQALSAPTLTLLKAADEAQLVRRMYHRPRFVEDVARECIKLAKERGISGRVKVAVEALESIHKHNAWAEIERLLAARA
jgi:GTP cyclohydrolase-4